MEGTKKKLSLTALSMINHSCLPPVFCQLARYLTPKQVSVPSEYLKSCVIRCQIAWYIMTSPSTVKPTVDFFKKNSYFGLSAEDVVVFQQGTLPCRTFQGKIIMASKHEISRQDTTPDCTMNLFKYTRRMVHKEHWKF